uniref:Uncharacterized protein n=1 Tax=viral metagenome TaxID=1070528 RepID=A0A6M3X6J0_9ZZZZ
MEINIISLNEEKSNTCGSCIHTNNNLGLVSLHCQLIYDEALKSDDPNAMENCDFAKVRSWNKCHFKPSRYNSLGETKK